jgi:hypothetical protein
VHSQMIISSGFDGVRLGYVKLVHAQMIINDGVNNIPPHDFKQLSRWYR